MAQPHFKPSRTYHHKLPRWRYNSPPYGASAYSRGGSDRHHGLGGRRSDRHHGLSGSFGRRGRCGRRDGHDRCIRRLGQRLGRRRSDRHRGRGGFSRGRRGGGGTHRAALKNSRKNESEQSGSRVKHERGDQEQVGKTVLGYISVATTSVSMCIYGTTNTLHRGYGLRVSGSESGRETSGN